jgi:hypothetical protein
MDSILTGWQCIFPENGTEYLNFIETNLRLQRAKLYFRLLCPQFDVLVDMGFSHVLMSNVFLADKGF